MFVAGCDGWGHEAAGTDKPIHHHLPGLAILYPVLDFIPPPAARDPLQIRALCVLLRGEVPGDEIQFGRTSPGSHLGGRESLVYTRQR